MRIQEDHTVRDATPEEEADAILVEAEQSEDATEQDYQKALNQMGVNFNENS